MKNKLLSNFKDKIINVFEQLEVIENEIDKLSDLIAEKVQKDEGRIIFVGAGISADMAKIIIDEMWFNFQIDNEKFLSITAAKSYASSLEKWKELEEMPSVSVFELESLNLNKEDLLIGLTSSGKTQYVTSAIDFAKKLGCQTAVITDMQKVKTNTKVDFEIHTNFGEPTIIGLNTAEGSTVQKIMIDNVIYLAMEKSGRIWNNSLVFMIPVSEKIEKYCIDVISRILKVDEDNAKELLYKYDKSLELVLISELKKISIDEAKTLLKENGNNFNKIV